MQAYKLQDKVDRDGQLIITEPTNLIPDDVEIIVLQSETKKDDIYPEKQLKNCFTKVKAFQEWFAKFDPNV